MAQKCGRGPIYSQRNKKYKVVGLDRYKLHDFQEDSLEAAIFKLKQQLHQKQEKLEQEFIKVDKNNSGVLEEAEFSLALERSKLFLNRKQKMELAALADINKDGDLSV